MGAQIPTILLFLKARNNFKKALIMYRPTDNRFKYFKNKTIDEIKKQIIYFNNIKTNKQNNLHIDIMDLKIQLNNEEEKQWNKYHK